MPRKAFIADFQVAAEKKGTGIETVARGENDEDITVCFIPPNGPLIEIGLLVVPDVGAYPLEHSFMIFTKSSDVPHAAASALEDIQNISPGKRLPELIETISQRLNKTLTKGSREDPVHLDDDSDIQMAEDDDEDDEDDNDEDDYDFGESYDDFDDDVRTDSKAFISETYQMDPESAANLNRRIRSDLRTARLAGFTVGILSGMKAESVSSLLSLSIRITKLGLSEEAIQAWDLEPEQYIVLLIRYTAGYKTFDAIISEAAKTHEVTFRVGISNRYKPTILQALAAFTDIAKDSSKIPMDGEGGETNLEDNKDVAGFTSLFISSSLNDFINAQFVSLVKIRHSVKLGWDGAKRYFNDKQGRFDDVASDLPDSYHSESTHKADAIPEVLTVDHLQDYEVKKHSFPLIAAQFTLRYLVRCTEFCLVCHDSIEEDFEALKPYVCSKPLCLYQYMSLGFGPSVEHEILTQPYVVDLLVSFCYSSAYNQKLREYPTGMSLAVPPVVNFQTRNYQPAFYRPSSASSPALTSDEPNLDVSIDVRFDVNRREVIFDDTNGSCPLRYGDWVVIESQCKFAMLRRAYDEILLKIPTTARVPDHYRVEDISLFPTVKLSSIPVTRTANSGLSGTAAFLTDGSVVPVTPATTPPPPAIVQTKLTMYNQNFDDMNDVSKAETIVMLLETLPSVKEMQSYLLHQSKYSEPSLRTWKDRISPAALGILRWIIASNRSCIVQVDRCPGQDEGNLALAKVRLDQRVSNVAEDWVQFRFAQGSPDKEQRFLNALRAQQADLDPKYPTIFAFHGSPLPNWHSIIRSGLDFKETLHGRAFGDGIYHALQQSTSVGYASITTNSWHGSALKINSAMSVNEIVNCPDQFASKHPYLVVQHIDWVQCRYLFVQANLGSANQSAVSHEPNQSLEVTQDSKYVAVSTLNKAIGVPFCAISTSRAFRIHPDGKTPKSKKSKSRGNTASLVTSDSISEGESISDIEFLFSGDESLSRNEQGKGKQGFVVLNSQKLSMPLTDFVPGSLDQSTLPMLELPSYSTPAATKQLNRALKEVIAIQRQTPLCELGWYIDESLISNVYQWIVELHSFDPDLLIAQDMKAAKITSIVLEIRFGKDYPFSPPFVRVIRPRFLPFMSGGGGHVTGGGAMCMELLTNSGWSSVSTIESVLLQVRMAIMNTEPKPARLENPNAKSQSDYGTGEAIEAYIRACTAHGWQIPPDFRAFAGVQGTVASSSSSGRF